MLTGSAKRGMVPHAQLFFGKEGGGALPMAVAYARYLHCTNKSGDDACGSCAACHKYRKLVHPDLHFIFPVSTTVKVKKAADAVSQHFLPQWREFLLENHSPTLRRWGHFYGGENKQPSISKEESRNIIRTLSLKPFESDTKVMLIWLPEQMHPSAANAILKILEEPPERTVFLLVTENMDRLLTTILSRTQLRHIPPYTDEDIAGFLMKALQLPTEQAEMAAYLADGNLAKAIEQAGEVDTAANDFFKQWMRACFKSDFTQLTEFTELFHKRTKDDQRALLHYGLNVVREAILVGQGQAQLMRVNDSERQFVTNFAKVVDLVKADRLHILFSGALNHLERNMNPKILFSNLSFSIAKLFKKG